MDYIHCVTYLVLSLDSLKLMEMEQVSIAVALWIRTRNVLVSNLDHNIFHTD
jgi:hypothetical protein